LRSVRLVEVIGREALRIRFGILKSRPIRNVESIDWL
jgi:hypothetical protein